MDQPAILVGRFEPDQRTMVRVRLPSPVSVRRPGQFFLLLCGDDCSATLRRTLFPAQIDDSAVPFPGNADNHPTVAWLAEKPPGCLVDLMGPFGNGFKSGSIPFSPRGWLLR